MQDRGGDGLSVRAIVVQDGRATREVSPHARAGWASAGWLLAALLTVASLPVSLSTLQSPVMTGSSLGTAVTYIGTTFYPWGGTSTVSTGPEAFQGTVSGGPNYVVPLLPSALVLMAAAVTGVLPMTRRSARPAERVVSAAAPVAAGVLIAVAACEWLSFRASSSLFESGGLYGDAPNPPEWSLGPSSWLVAAAALIALITWVFLARRPAEASAGPGRQPPAAVEHEGANPERSLSTVFPVSATTDPTQAFTRPGLRPPHNHDDGDIPPLDLTLFQRPSESGPKPS